MLQQEVLYDKTGARKKESNLDSNIMNWETNFNLIDLK